MRTHPPSHTHAGWPAGYSAVSGSRGDTALPRHSLWVSHTQPSQPEAPSLKAPLPALDSPPGPWQQLPEFLEPQAPLPARMEAKCDSVLTMTMSPGSTLWGPHRCEHKQLVSPDRDSAAEARGRPDSLETINSRHPFWTVLAAKPTAGLRVRGGQSQQGLSPALEGLATLLGITFLFQHILFMRRRLGQGNSPNSSPP